MKIKDILRFLLLAVVLIIVFIFCWIPVKFFPGLLGEGMHEKYLKTKGKINVNSDEKCKK